MSRRDSFSVSPVSMVSEPPAKRSKVEPCKAVSPKPTWRTSETTASDEADEDTWEHEDDHPTDSWGALNLTQGGEVVQNRKHSESETVSFDQRCFAKMKMNCDNS
jgi:hypothetical protein